MQLQDGNHLFCQRGKPNDSLSAVVFLVPGELADNITRFNNVQDELAAIVVRLRGRFTRYHPNTCTTIPQLR